MQLSSSRAPTQSSAFTLQEVEIQRLDAFDAGIRDKSSRDLVERGPGYPGVRMNLVKIGRFEGTNDKLVDFALHGRR